MPLKDAIYTWLCLYSHWDQPSWLLHPFTPRRMQQLPNSQPHQPSSLQASGLILHSLQASSLFTCRRLFPQRPAKYGCQAYCMTWKKKKKNLKLCLSCMKYFSQAPWSMLYFCISLAPVKAVHSFPAYGVYSLLLCLCLCWFFLLCWLYLSSDLTFQALIGTSCLLCEFFSKVVLSLISVNTFIDHSHSWMSMLFYP